jgi:TRAP-type C4-dicarboxylate transport system permease small subunit
MADVALNTKLILLGMCLARVDSQHFMISVVKYLVPAECAERNVSMFTGLPFFFFFYPP